MSVYRITGYTARHRERSDRVGLNTVAPQSEFAAATSERLTAVQIPLADLHIGPTARSGVNQARVAALAEEPGSWSPLLVQAETLAILDGIHRYHAAMALKISSVRCEIFDGDEHAAFVEAVRRNVSQGLPLRLPERQRAARRLLAIRGEWADRMIASICGLSPTTVRELRRCSTAQNGQLNGRMGADGRIRPIDREDLHRRTEQAIRANPGASLQRDCPRGTRKSGHCGEDSFPGAHINPAPYAFSPVTISIRQSRKHGQG